MEFPRIMISAVSSGSGKTLITCGLLQALKNRGLKAGAFKCGPDYIDPMFHKKVLKMPSRNLDTFFTNEKTMRYLFTSAAKDYDISVIEGVMGYYDGIGARSHKGSAYELSKNLKTPVIIVVNAKGMSLSAAAIIKGIMEFRDDNPIQGVILNQVSERIYPQLKCAIEKELFIKVLGYLPKVNEFILESRHLGLVLPNEIKEMEIKIEKLAELLEQTVDIDQILQLAGEALQMELEEFKSQKLPHSPAIAIAKDEVFCFYYEENIELMKQMGAEIIEFSPLHDKYLPKHINGLILGGGYPELYAKQLSENQSMIMEIKEYVKKNRPILAECGGFMYLHDTMEDNNKKSYKMVGAIHGHVYKTNKLGRFGYITLSPKKEDLFLQEEMKGHEFHYFDSSNCGDSYLASKPLSNREWSCIHGSNNQCMGFPHIYYYSNPNFIYQFLLRCK